MNHPIFSRFKRHHFISVPLLTAAFLIFIGGCSQQPLTPDNAPIPACAVQLKAIVGAKKAWAEQNNKSTNDTPTVEDLTPLMRRWLSCPNGGTYTLGAVGEMPKCSIPEHQAAFVKMMQTAAAAAPAPPAQ